MMVQVKNKNKDWFHFSQNVCTFNSSIFISFVHKNIKNVVVIHIMYAFLFIATNISLIYKGGLL